MKEEEGLPYLARKSKKFPKLDTSSDAANQANLANLITTYQLWLHGIDSTLSFDAALIKLEKLTKERRARIYFEELVREERRIKLGLDKQLTRDEDGGVDAPVTEAIKDRVFTRDDDGTCSLNQLDDEHDLIVVEDSSSTPQVSSTQSQEAVALAAKIRAKKDEALANLAAKRRTMLAALDDYDDDEDNANADDTPIF